MDLLITNIGTLCTCAPDTESGSPVQEISDATVFCENGVIRYAGPRADFGIPVPPGTRRLDAGGMLVTPGFVDSHTHLVFVGSREDEFRKRALGTPYAEIARDGGGILSTVRAVRRATIEDLVRASLPRLWECARQGTTTIEIKSGYGLSTEAELRMLAAIQRLSRHTTLDIVPTFLGAHEIPPEYRGNRRAYIDLLLNETIPAVARQGIARFGDAFCESHVFNAAESQEILRAMADAGLGLKVHADQLTDSGAAAVAGRVGAVSADHLERISAAGISAMAEAGVVATLLPASSFFLGGRQADARRLLDAGLTVALATDFNPGSSMTPSMPLVMTIAVAQMGMTPAETLWSATMGGAKALGMEGRAGSIEKGKQADLLIHDAPNVDFLPYYFGRNPVRAVVKRGRVLHRV